MKAKRSKHSVVVELSTDEALVFMNWLFRFNEKANSEMFEDQSEERVLWDFEAILEKIISETVSADYVSLLAKARREIRDN